MRAGLVETGGVLVLHKTLDILESIKNTPSGVKLSDLARAVDMPKATVYRILATLESRGLLDRMEDGGYRMTRGLFGPPFAHVLKRAALPRMHDLAKCTRETVNLGMFDGGEFVMVDTIESFPSDRMTPPPAGEMHLHTTAIGKVLLAALPEKDALRVVRQKGLPRLTPHSIATPSALLQELEQVREQGYALDNQETDLEMRCIGAPIEGPDGRVAAALGVSGPVLRMDPNRVRWVEAKLKLTCLAISVAARG
jgi:IclR family acetate operon transcriptional repressor